ncbi:MAG TPA: hypothetical protein VLG40_04465 [Candidatus Saccharimonas sp.]|nr:hypothetical protein [Candidatus Saccharimonas sp.]
MATVLDPQWIIAAVLFRIAAGLDYVVATIRGKALPNPVTWLLWGLSPLLAFFAQIQKTIEPTAWVTLALSIGPLVVFFIAITRKHRWKVSWLDIVCGICAGTGLLLWQMTSEPVMALVFGIAADILGGVPTVVKTWAVPGSEKATAYFLSMVSMVITLFTIHSWSFLSAGFPLYILLINSVLFLLSATKVGPKIAKILDNTTVRHR